MTVAGNMSVLSSRVFFFSRPPFPLAVARYRKTYRAFRGRPWFWEEKSEMEYQKLSYKTGFIGPKVIGVTRGLQYPDCPPGRSGSPNWNSWTQPLAPPHLPTGLGRYCQPLLRRSANIDGTHGCTRNSRLLPIQHPLAPDLCNLPGSSTTTYLDLL